MESVQDRVPANRCFGCGPENEKGLRIKSFVADCGEEVVAEWRPEPHQEAFDGIFGRLTATCRGTFTAVKEGHPTFHRW